MLEPSSQEKIDDELRNAAIRGFLGIAKVWQLDRHERMAVLGIAKAAEYNAFVSEKDARLNATTLERISYLFGIYKALNTIFREPDRADAWIRKPNQAPLFEGKSALDLMMSGDIKHLRWVRQYLDAEANGALSEVDDNE